MRTFSMLLDLACGRSVPAEDEGRARRIQILVAASLGALLLGAVWGLAAGSSSLTLALGNVYKVPMVILLSALCAIPAGMLAWKLSGVKYRGIDLLTSFVVGVFAATLVLAVLSPLVALYYRSSAWAGPILGLGSTTTAILVGTIIFVRGALNRVPDGVARRSIVLPMTVLLLMVLATSVQFIAIASPILPEKTIFDGGIDRMVKR